MAATRGRWSPFLKLSEQHLSDCLMGSCFLIILFLGFFSLGYTVQLLES